jgi:DNA topoisomerase-1
MSRSIGSRIHISFRGKSGKHHETDINDRRLASFVKDCRDLPEYELFQYLVDKGARLTVRSAEVNDYSREITGELPKISGTWAGTQLAAKALRQFV